MTVKQTKAREYVAASFTDALQGIDDVLELLPQAGFPVPQALTEQLQEARRLIVDARLAVAQETYRERSGTDG